DAEASENGAPRRFLEPELEPHVEVAEPYARLAQLVVDHLPHAGALLHQHERLLLQLVERDRPAGEAVPAWHGQHDLVAEERLEDHPAMTPHGADAAELHLAARDLLDHPLRIRDGERHLDTAVLPLELGEGDRDHRSARPGG